MILFRLLERHCAAADCTQIANGSSIGPAANLAICEFPCRDAFFLFFCDPEWKVLAATRHDSFEEANDRAELEYIDLGEWES